MQYLILSPDYTGRCIKAEFTGEVVVDVNDELTKGKFINKLGLPSRFIDEFSTWYRAYKKLIPLDERELFKKKELINSLDEQGLAFCRQLPYLIPGGAKVKYFSEVRGKLFIVT